MLRCNSLWEEDQERDWKRRQFPWWEEHLFSSSSSFLWTNDLCRALADYFNNILIVRRWWRIIHITNKQINITKTWRINYQLKRWDDVGWLHALSWHFVSVFSVRKRSCYMNSRTLILLSSSSFSCAHRLHVPVWLEMSWSRLWSSHHHNSNRRRWTRRRNGNCKIIITFPQNHLQCFQFILGMTFLWFTTEQEDDDDEEEQDNQRLSWTLTAKSRERWKKLNIYVTCTFCQYLSLSPPPVDPLHPHNNITRRHIQVQSSHPRMNSSSSRGTTIASAERHQLETRDERERKIEQDYE